MNKTSSTDTINLNSEYLKYLSSFNKWDEIPSYYQKYSINLNSIPEQLSGSSKGKQKMIFTFNSEIIKLNIREQLNKQDLERFQPLSLLLSNLLKHMNKVRSVLNNNLNKSLNKINDFSHSDLSRINNLIVNYTKFDEEIESLLKTKELYNVIGNYFSLSQEEQSFLSEKLENSTDLHLFLKIIKLIDKISNIHKIAKMIEKEASLPQILSKSINEKFESFLNEGISVLVSISKILITELENPNIITDVTSLELFAIYSHILKLLNQSPDLHDHVINLMIEARSKAIIKGLQIFKKNTILNEKIDLQLSEYILVLKWLIESPKDEIEVLKNLGIISPQFPANYSILYDGVYKSINQLFQNRVSELWGKYKKTSSIAIPFLIRLSIEYFEKTKILLDSDCEFFDELGKIKHEADIQFQEANKSLIKKTQEFVQRIKKNKTLNTSLLEILDDFLLRPLAYTIEQRNFMQIPSFLDTDMIISNESLLKIINEFDSIENSKDQQILLSKLQKAIGESESVKEIFVLISSRLMKIEENK